MEALLEQIRKGLDHEVKQAVLDVAHVIGVEGPGTPESAGSAVKWEEGEVTRKIVRYIWKAAGDAEVASLVTKWRKLCKELVSKAMIGYSASCGETEWYYQIDLAPAFARVVWEILAEHGQHIPPQAIHDAVELDYHDKIERGLLEKAMWETVTATFSVDRKDQSKIYKALGGSYWTAVDEAVRRPQPRNEHQDLQLVQEFLEDWIEDTLIRAWHGTENASEVLCTENVAQLFTILVAPYGEEHPFTCIPGALIERIGRPPTGWAFVAQAAEEVLSHFGPDGHVGKRANVRRDRSGGHKSADWAHSKKKAAKNAGASNDRQAAKPRGHIAVKRGAAAVGHDSCTSEEDCIGHSTDRLIQHQLNGRAGDIYCESCWVSFVENNPSLEGDYID
jgi:hypothetical protein